jgi:hypothetical protein
MSHEGNNDNSHIRKDTNFHIQDSLTKLRELEVSGSDTEVLVEEEPQKRSVADLKKIWEQNQLVTLKELATGQGIERSLGKDGVLDTVSPNEPEEKNIDDGIIEVTRVNTHKRNPNASVKDIDEKRSFFSSNRTKSASDVSSSKSIMSSSVSSVDELLKSSTDSQNDDTVTKNTSQPELSKSSKGSGKRESYKTDGRTKSFTEKFLKGKNGRVRKLKPDQQEEMNLVINSSEKEVTKSQMLDEQFKASMSSIVEKFKEKDFKDAKSFVKRFNEIYKEPIQLDFFKELANVPKLHSTVSYDLEEYFKTKFIGQHSDGEDTSSFARLAVTSAVSYTEKRKDIDEKLRTERDKSKREKLEQEKAELKELSKEQYVKRDLLAQIDKVINDVLQWSPTLNALNILCQSYVLGAHSFSAKQVAEDSACVINNPTSKVLFFDRITLLAELACGLKDDKIWQEYPFAIMNEDNIQTISSLHAAKKSDDDIVLKLGLAELSEKNIQCLLSLINSGLAEGFLKKTVLSSSNGLLYEKLTNEEIDNNLKSDLNNLLTCKGRYDEKLGKMHFGNHIDERSIVLVQKEENAERTRASFSSNELTTDSSVPEFSKIKEPGISRSSSQNSITGMPKSTANDSIVKSPSDPEIRRSPHSNLAESSNSVLRELAKSPRGSMADNIKKDGGDSSLNRK